MRAFSQAQTRAARSHANHKAGTARINQVRMRYNNGANVPAAAGAYVRNASVACGSRNDDENQACAPCRPE